MPLVCFSHPNIFTSYQFSKGGRKAKKSPQKPTLLAGKLAKPPPPYTTRHHPSTIHLRLTTSSTPPPPPSIHLNPKNPDFASLTLRFHIAMHQNWHHPSISYWISSQNLKSIEPHSINTWFNWLFNYLQNPNPNSRIAKTLDPKFTFDSLKSFKMGVIPPLLTKFRPKAPS